MCRLSERLEEMALAWSFRELNLQLLRQVKDGGLL